MGEVPLRWGLLLLVLLVSVCTAGLVATNQVRAAAVCMWAMVVLFGMALACFAKAEEMVVLLIACAPLVNLLRGAMLYSGVSLLYFAALGYFALARPARVREVARRNPLVVYLLAAAFAYYFVSVAWTGEPRQNLRVFELAFLAALVPLVGNSATHIATALVGVLISAWAVAIGAYPHVASHSSMRLGIIATDGLALGNPFALGMALALGVLALVLDEGRWVGLRRFRTLRLVFLAPTLFFLAQSGSRAGQLVALFGILLAAVISRGNRTGILGVLLLIGILTYGLLHLPFATSFQMGFERTFGEDRTLARATAGRTDQWSTFGHALIENPVSFLFGHGIGNGREVHARVSATLPDNVLAGRPFDFHALVMHVGVELGLLGLAAMFIWAAFCVAWCARGVMRTGTVFPAVCLAGFFLGTATTSGFDTVSGILLGIGLLHASKSVTPSRHTLINNRLVVGKRPLSALRYG